MTPKQKSDEYAKTVVLLIDPENPTEEEKRQVATVANHWLKGYREGLQFLLDMTEDSY